MSPFQPFELERYMSKFEQDVTYNLTESGVHPVSLEELTASDPSLLEQLLSTELNYPYVNGIPGLRQNIARLYDGATSENVLVTVGAIEANHIATTTMLSPGDELVVMLPNYMQIWGIAQNLGCQLKSFHLQEHQGWAPDLAELKDVVGSKTKLIAICNPNNPTGYVMNQAEIDEIIRIADGVGAWILADEVYAGAERLTDNPTPSIYGKYERAIAIGSLSKAYGLPGLRIGWVVAPPEKIDAFWARHEYMTISATMLSNVLATMALTPQVRQRLLHRTRALIRQGYPILEEWMSEQPGLFSHTPPQAGAITFVRYRLDMNSSELAARLRQRHSVLVVPGDLFGMDHFLRISFGLPYSYLRPALDRLGELLIQLRA